MRWLRFCSVTAAYPIGKSAFWPWLAYEIEEGFYGIHEGRGYPSSTVRGQKQRFSGGTPRSHAGFRPFSAKVV
jgi:hypothetical protein